MLDLHAIAESSEELSALSGSALRLTNLLSGSDWLISDIVHTIELDQALTGRILRLANSSASGAQCKVNTVQDGVMRMGTGPILSLALASGVQTKMTAGFEWYEEEEDALWRHSVASALAVQNSHRFCKQVPMVECFVAALLHDIGFLALDRWLMTVPEGEERERAFGEIREADHGILAGTIASRWELSPEVQEAVTYHHTPGQAPSERGQLSASFVSLGECVAVAVGAGFGSENVRLERETAQRLRIDRAGFDGLREETRSQLGEILELYAA